MGFMKPQSGQTEAYPLVVTGRRLELAAQGIGLLRDEAPRGKSGYRASFERTPQQLGRHGVLPCQFLEG